MAQPRIGDTIAAIDLGSNSFHLAVARVLENRVQLLHKVKQRVQLAEGMDADGNLAPAAIERGLECLAQFAQHLENTNLSEIRVVATYALRSAPNRRKFVKAARKVLDTPIEVIAGSEEARLIFVGVAQALELKGNSLVIDIGGGSTEVVIGEGRTPKLLTSLNMGCVSYHDRFFADGELTKKRFKKAVTAAQQQLEPILERYQRKGWSQAIGCSGTIKALRQLCLDEQSPELLSTKALEQLQQDLIDAGHTDNCARLDQLSESRRRVIPAGLAVLLGCCRSLNIEQIRFCSSALREGVIVEMCGEQDHDSICAETVAAMERLHHVDTEHGQRVAKTAAQLFKSSPHCDKARLPLLKWAARLLEVGLSLNFRGMHRHSGYILSNSNLPGFTVEQQQLLGWLGRFQRKRLDECQPLELQLAEPEAMFHMLLVLRLSALWHLGRRHQIALPTLTWQERELTVSVPSECHDDTLLFADIEQEQQLLQTINWQLTVKPELL